MNHDTDKYYVAKEIAELFYCQADDLEIKNQEAPADEHWTVSGREVHFNTKTSEIEIETNYFNEFETEGNERPTIYSFYESFSSRHCRTCTDFGEVIGIYFDIFQKDYDAYFSIRDW